MIRKSSQLAEVCIQNQFNTVAHLNSLSVLLNRAQVGYNKSITIATTSNITSPDSTSNTSLITLPRTGIIYFNTNILETYLRVNKLTMISPSYSLNRAGNPELNDTVSLSTGLIKLNGYKMITTGVLGRNKHQIYTIGHFKAPTIYRTINTSYISAHNILRNKQIQIYNRRNTIGLKVQYSYGLLQSRI